jgi:hypothetical protein
MTKYTEYVKAYAAEHKMTYKEAMKAASASYKSAGKGVESPVVAPVEVPVAVEEPKYIMTGCVAQGFPVWEDNVVSKPKKVRASKAKGVKPVEDSAIYPLDIVKVLKME